MPTNQEFPYDVFLSHSAKDKAVVRRFDTLSASNGERARVRCRSLDWAERLRQDGLKVWFDEWVPVGRGSRRADEERAKIEAGLEHSRVQACPAVAPGRRRMLCMSANAFGSDWAQLEAGTCGRGNGWERRLAVRDPLNQERRFIPLRLDDAPIKGSLAQFLHINWRPADRERVYLGPDV